MAKKKSTKKAAKSKSSKVAKTLTPAQIAGQITWTLKGHLKNVQLSYLRVGAELAHIRDNKLFAALRHETMEEYADQRLALGRTSLFKYLQVYQWAKTHHPEWLEPKPKGFIPDLSDAANLIRIEQDLATTTLSPERRATLEALRVKGLAGHLKQDEVERAYRAPRSPRPQDSLASFVSKLRALRTRGARLAKMPAEAISHIDAALDVLTHHQTLAQITLPSKQRLLQYIA